MILIELGENIGALGGYYVRRLVASHPYKLNSSAFKEQGKYVVRGIAIWNI
jgi:hypothetical protein